MMVMLRFIFSLAVILACLGITCLGTIPSQAQDVADITELQHQAEQGDVEAQTSLARFYLSGQGAQQDYAKAKEWFEKAVSQGDAEAQFGLGVMFYNGVGMLQDYGQAAKWFRLAAEQDYAEGQYMLGLVYAIGEGVRQNHKEAIKWISRAAAQGIVDAQISLAGKYAKGEGVPQDHKQEAKWLSLAAAQGHAGAQFRLGAMYANGLGVPQDYVQAHKWVNLAAAQGNKNAADLRNDLAKEMTPDQIAEAQRLAQEETLWATALTAAKNISFEQTKKTVAETVSPNNTQIRLETEALKIQAQHPYVAEIDNLPPEIRDEAWARITDEAVASLAQKGISPADGTFDSRLALIHEKAALTNKYGPQYTGKKMGIFDDLIPSLETAQNRAARDGFVPLPLEQAKKTGSWEDSFVPIVPAPATEQPPTPEKKSLAPQMTMLNYVLASVLITWGIGLTPPLLIRFAFLKRPINKKYAFLVCALFLLVNATVFIALGSESKTHVALYLIAYVSYLILTHTTKLKSSSSSSQTIFYANKRG